MPRACAARSVSHVRRTNPRDSLDPNPGSSALGRGRQAPPDAAAGPRLRPSAVGRRRPARAPATADAPRGLYFICLNANISRQFEFIQQTWVNSPKFAGLYDDPDPLLAPSGSFSIPGSPVRRRLTGVPRFVTVRGGAYLLLPGLRAVRYLAGLGAA